MHSILLESVIHISPETYVAPLGQQRSSNFFAANKLPLNSRSYTATHKRGIETLARNTEMRQGLVETNLR